MTTHLSKSTLKFLKDLAKNNDRDWFNEHKDRYRTAHEEVIALADHLLDRFSEFDEIETPTGKKATMRIYRDTRFSKDKTPYKTNFGVGFKRATQLRRGGYYLHLTPGSSFVGGGFWGPESHDLKRIRQELGANAEPLREIIADGEFKRLFGQLEGDQLKTAPQGFARDHKNIDLLRYKQFLVKRDFTDAQVTSPDFADMVMEGFRGMQPFFAYMTEILTTDANGEPLYEE